MKGEKGIRGFHSKLFNLILPLLSLSLCLWLFIPSPATAQSWTFWRDIGLALELGMRDLAIKRLESHKPANPHEKERTWLALGYTYLKLGKGDKAKGYLSRIPTSSPYFEAAQALSWSQKMEIEEVKGVIPPTSPPYKVFQKTLPKNPVEALDYLVLNSPFLLPGEKEKGVLAVIRLLFWKGDDDRVLALLRRFPFLTTKEEAVWKGALAHYRRGEFTQALSLLSSLPLSPRVHYWQALVLQTLGKDDKARGHLSKAAKGWGFYPFLARLRLGLSPPSYKPCPTVSLSPRGFFHDLVEMGMEDVAEKVIMDRLWSQKISKDQALALFSAINPFIALKLSMKGCLMYPYRELVEGFCRLYRVEVPLAYAVMRQESLFDKRSLSRSNAMGLMQVLPSTGEFISQRLRTDAFAPSMLFVPIFGIKYGVWYLSHLQKQFPTLTLVVAAYNAGPTAVGDWYKKWGMASPPEVAEYYPKAETRNYVKRVITYYLLYSWEGK